MLGSSLSEDGSGFYLYIRRSSEGSLLGGVYTLQETGLTGPLSIYKLVPKVVVKNIDTPMGPRSAKTPVAGKMIIPSGWGEYELIKDDLIRIGPSERQTMEKKKRVKVSVGHHRASEGYSTFETREHDKDPFNREFFVSLLGGGRKSLMSDHTREQDRALSSEDERVRSTRG